MLRKLFFVNKVFDKRMLHMEKYTPNSKENVSWKTCSPDWKYTIISVCRHDSQSNQMVRLKFPGRLIQ